MHDIKRLVEVESGVISGLGEGASACVDNDVSARIEEEYFALLCKAMFLLNNTDEAALIPGDDDMVGVDFY